MNESTKVEQRNPNRDIQISSCARESMPRAMDMDEAPVRPTPVPQDAKVVRYVPWRWLSGRTYCSLASRVAALERKRNS